MAYQKTTWIDGQTKLNADNLNHIEDGLEKASSSVDLPRLIPNINALKARDDTLDYEVKIYSKEENFSSDCKSYYACPEVGKFQFYLSSGYLDENCFIAFFQRKFVNLTRHKRWAHLRDDTLNMYNRTNYWLNSASDIYAPDASITLRTEWNIAIDETTQRTSLTGNIPIALNLRNTRSSSTFKRHAYIKYDIVENGVHKVTLIEDQRKRFKARQEIAFAVVRFTDDMKRPQIGPMTVFEVLPGVGLDKNMQATVNSGEFVIRLKE